MIWAIVSKDEMENYKAIPENFCAMVENNDFKDFNTNEIVITNGSKGSRVISDKEYKMMTGDTSDWWKD